MNFGEMMSAFLWLAAAIILAIVEANTVQLVSIWFAVGAAAAMVASIFTASLGAQCAVFAVVSAVTLAVMLPLLAKKVNLDPAIMAAPIITTLVDTCSIAIYFTVATRLFAL